MKIKKFRGTTFKEAVNKMKMEFGPNAIILESDKVEQNFNGSGTSYYEITAATQDDQPTPSQETPVQPVAPEKVVKAQSTQLPQNGNGNGKPHPSTATTSIPEPVITKIVEQSKEIRALRQELKEIKTVLTKVSEHLKHSETQTLALPELYKKLYRQLVANEVHEELAKGIVNHVYSHTNALDHNNKTAVLKNLYSLLIRFCKVAKPVVQVPHKPYIVSLIGPTGVGKTTTVAKLAANFKLYSQMDVALISVDTYRVGAIEQLQTFAKIANIPMTVVFSPEEMDNALAKFREYDIIMIDTVGRSQKDHDHLQNLKEFIARANPDETHLVLSLTTSLKTMLDIIKHFKILSPNRLIFSKVDEAVKTGNILNVLYKYQIPVSYLTVGQVVPTDIKTATESMLANLVFSGKLPSN